MTTLDIWTKQSGLKESHSRVPSSGQIWIRYLQSKYAFFIFWNWFFSLVISIQNWLSQFISFLTGVFAKNERVYRLTAKNYRWWSLLILRLSVASKRRNLLKTTHTEEHWINYVINCTLKVVVSFSLIK